MNLTYTLTSHSFSPFSICQIDYNYHRANLEYTALYIVHYTRQPGEGKFDAFRPEGRRFEFTPAATLGPWESPSQTIAC